MQYKKTITQNDLDRYHKLGKLNLKVDLPRKLKKEFKNLLKRLTYRYSLINRQYHLISESMYKNEKGKWRSLRHFYLQDFQTEEEKAIIHNQQKAIANTDEIPSVFEGWVQPTGSGLGSI